jgi:Mn-dependent DtxR family transcriptional regulator
MAALSVDGIFEAAVRILLEEEKLINLVFSPGNVMIRFPTTRRLADYLKVPHYYVLPYFAMMEEMQLVTRAERVGILTTSSGTKKLVDMISKGFRNEALLMMGENVLSDLESRVHAS